MIEKKEISKEITFFYYENITSTIIDELLEFVRSNPTFADGQYTDGTNILISHIKITISDNEPYSFLIGINTSGGIKEVKIYPKKYYFFKNETIQFVENPDDVVFWD